jgi:hypothetical protein
MARLVVGGADADIAASNPVDSAVVFSGFIHNGTLSVISSSETFFVKIS